MTQQLRSGTLSQSPLSSSRLRNRSSVMLPLRGASSARTPPASTWMVCVCYERYGIRQYRQDLRSSLSGGHRGIPDARCKLHGRALDWLQARSPAGAPFSTQSELGARRRDTVARWQRLQPLPRLGTTHQIRALNSPRHHQGTELRSLVERGSCLIWSYCTISSP